MGEWDYLDEHTLSGIASGKPQYISLLYTKLKIPHSTVMRIISKQSWGFGADVEDIFQEIFIDRILPAMRCFQAQGDEEPANQAGKLIVDITKKACIDFYRKARASKRGADLRINLDDEVIERIFAEDTSPLEVSIKQQRRQKLYEAISRLDPICRDVISLRLQEFTSSEIARRLNMKVSAVETRIFRCLKTLRNLIK